MNTLSQKSSHLLTLFFVGTITCMHSDSKMDTQKSIHALLKSERRENFIKEDARQQWLRSKHYKNELTKKHRAKKASRAQS